MKPGAKLLKTVGNIGFRFVRKHPEPDNPKKIILFTLPGIGDELMITPSIRGLRQKYPHAQIDAQVFKSTYPVLANNPHLDYVFIGGRDIETMKKIQQEGYDMAICYRFFTTPLFAYLCGVPYRRGPVLNGNGFALTEGFERRPGESSIDFMNRYAGVPDAGRKMEWDLPETDLPEMYKLYPLVMVPDAGTIEVATRKTWPSRYWSMLANKLGRPVTLVGLDKERADQIKAHLEVPYIDLTGKTSITEFAKIIKEAGLVVCNDSAAMHIASTFDTPCVTIFGPTNDKYLAHENTTVIKGECPYGYGSCFYLGDKILLNCPRDCLTSITPDQVAREIRGMKE